jgi:hypothetical protein
VTLTAPATPGLSQYEGVTVIRSVSVPDRLPVPADEVTNIGIRNLLKLSYQSQARICDRFFVAVARPRVERTSAQFLGRPVVMGVVEATGRPEATPDGIVTGLCR